MKKQRCRFRQKLGLFLAAGMVISGVHFAVLPVSAAAEGESADISADISATDTIEEMGNSVNELSREDINTLSGDDTASGGEPQALAVDSADVINIVHEQLGNRIKEIAAGTSKSSQIDIFSILAEKYPNADDFNAAVEEIKANSDAIYNSLLSEYQNELFWHDKTNDSGGIQFLCNATTTDGIVKSGSATLSLAVLPEYRIDSSDPYSVSVDAISAANDYLANAQKIIDANTDKSDYEKLLAYKDAICGLVSYDHDAAANGYSGSKLPWSMISVFDENPDTNVVCEGYSKAFQYLCDHSAFKNAKCYTVSGTMKGGVGEGPHMWNIVSIEGGNYLVDVTNCDENAVGAPDLLFLAIPASGSWDTSYTFNAHAAIKYTYDAGAGDESVLKLATTAYDPTKDSTDSDNDKPDDSSTDSNKPNGDGSSDSNKPNGDGSSDSNKPNGDGSSDSNKPNGDGSSDSNKPNGDSDNNKPDNNKPNNSNKPSGRPDNSKPGSSKPTSKPDNNKPSSGSKPSSKPSSSTSGSSSNTGTTSNTGAASNTQTSGNTANTLQNWGVVSANPSDQNTYRLTVGSTIEVTAELQNNENLNTPAKIETLIKNNLTSKGISNENIKVYDLALQINVNGVYQDATAENFPAEGITITIPYPAGTDSSYNFVANHLFTKSMNGYPAGHIESFPENGAIEKTASGISFTVHGLSPVSIGWSKSSDASANNSASTNNTASTNVSPKTGDTNAIMFYMALMILAAIIGTIYAKRVNEEN